MKKNIFILFVLLLGSSVNFVYGLTPGEQRAVSIEQQLIEQKENLEKQKQDMRKLKDEIKRRSREKKYEVQKPKETIPQEDKTTIYIATITVEGVRVFSKKTIKAIVRPYEKKQLAKSEIGQLQGKLLNLYLERGYISARVYLDTSNKKANTLKFVVLEGVIENIYFSDTAQGKMPLRTVFFRQKNRTLNIRGLEQGLEQLNRLQSNNATMQIKPGKTDGGTEVEIINTPKRRMRFIYGINNSGTEETGRYKHNIELQGDNLLRLSEAISVNYGNGLEDDTGKRYTKNFGSSLCIPLGYWTFSCNYAAYEYLATIQGVTRDISSKTDSKNVGFSAGRVLSRGKRYKIAAGLDITRKESNNYLNGTKLDVSSKQLIPASLYATHLLFLQQGVISSKASYIRGLDILDARKDPSNMDVGQPVAQYQAVTLNEYFSYQFLLPYTKIPLTYNMSLSGQYCWNDLFGTEQFTPNVRGFKEGGISGETGASASNDVKVPLSYILPFKNKAVQPVLSELSLGCFYDRGSVSHKTFGGEETISGWGFGISGQIFDMVDLSVSLSNPLESPAYIVREDNVLNVCINITIPFKLDIGGKSS